MSPYRLETLGADHVRAAAAIIGEAFRDEGVARSQFDMDDPHTRRLFARSSEVQMLRHLAAGHPALGAFDGPNLVAVALLRRPQGRLGLMAAARITLPRLGALLPLLFRYRLSSLGVLRLLRPPDGVLTPHHTLEALAVDPAHQGRGLARRLLTWAAEIVAEDPTSQGTYLLAAGERNRTVYERLGYAVLESQSAHGVTGYHMFRRRDAEGGVAAS